jgi:two-component system KDP operon response regulator KdpE
VVILTAHGSLDSAVAAIREGVDGYLLKPVEPDEVRRAAQEALERRSRLRTGVPDTPPGRTLTRGPFTVDLQTHEVHRHGQPVDLTPRELKLLVHLMRNAPKVISPKELVSAVRDYRPEYMHEARQIIKWYVYRLRQKVEENPSNPRHIVNVRGVGYAFKE